MFVVLRTGEEKADVVQHRRGMENARVLLGQLVQLMQLVKQIERQLADMVRVGGIVEILLTDLIERFGAVGVRVPGAAFRVAPLQQIDHQAVAQTAAGDENILEADLRHDLVEDEVRRR